MKVVILCGGKGTRSYPYTEYFPKPMMPVGGKPIIAHLMHIYAAQGFTEFVLAAGHRKELLHDYFDNRFPRWNVQVVDTGEDSDTGDRIRNCEPMLDGEPFFATYGDGLGDIDLSSLLAFHQQSGGLATVTSVPLPSQYGTLETDSADRVIRFREKPVIQQHWINAGFFVFSPDVFRHWEGSNLESHMLPKLAAMRELYVFRHQGFWKSMDTSKDQQEMEKLQMKGAAPWVRTMPIASGY